jgi:hypothetical protein
MFQRAGANFALRHQLWLGANFSRRLCRCKNSFKNSPQGFPDVSPETLVEIRLNFEDLNRSFRHLCLIRNLMDLLVEAMTKILVAKQSNCCQKI